MTIRKRLTLLESQIPAVNQFSHLTDEELDEALWAEVCKVKKKSGADITADENLYRQDRLQAVLEITRWFQKNISDTDLEGKQSLRSVVEIYERKIEARETQGYSPRVWRCIQRLKIRDGIGQMKEATQ